MTGSIMPLMQGAFLFARKPAQRPFFTPPHSPLIMKPSFLACCLLLPAFSTLQSTPLEDKLLAMFESKCADCHKEDEEPELSQNTRLSALRSDTKLVVPGDAKASELFKVLVLPADDKDRMPKSSKKKPLPPLKPEEIELVRQWINGETPPAPPAATASATAAPKPDAAPTAAPAATAAAPRAFISSANVDELILADLKKLKQGLGGIGSVRYLSLANIYNERDASGKPRYGEDELEDHRTAINKLLNSLSWKAEITKATPIDPARVIFRIDLGVYGFAPDIWHRIASGYPYLVERDSAAAAEARKLIGDLHVMRADYFTFICAQPPFYHLLLNLPGGTKQRRSDVELENMLGIVYHRDVQKPETVRAGFQNSGVSQGNRLVERIDRGDAGYYWKSYDFDTRRQNERGGDLFRTPLGPIDAGLTKNQGVIFSQDGGELIFTLPNGLQAYMLIDALGIRLDEAPINVVTDDKRKDARIINGISCMKCHQAGMFPCPPDTVLASTANLKLEAHESAALARLHDAQKFDKAIKADSKRFLAAVAQCGPVSDENLETVTLLYDHYRNAILPHQIHAELELDPSADLISVLGRIQNPEVVNLTAKIKSNTPTPREDFEKTFASIVDSIGMGKVPQRERIAVIEFGGDLDRNTVNRDEANSAPTVKGGSAQRPVLRLPNLGGNTSVAPQPSVGTTAVPSGAPGMSNGERRPVARIDANGTRADAGGNLPAVAPSMAPNVSPGVTTPVPQRMVRRIGPDGLPLPAAGQPASATPPAVPPTGAGTAPCPTPPTGAAVPKAAPSAPAPSKPVRKIGADGKPTP